MPLFTPARCAQRIPPAKRRLPTAYLVLCLALTLLPIASSQAETLTFDSAADWQSWQWPYGLIQVGETGQLELVRYRRDIDAVEDAHLFTHPTNTRGEAVAGGIWEAGSSANTAARILDGDSQTYWQPDPADPLGKWFVQVDLGRAVLAKEIRLTFANEEGARPFSQFTVFTATGISADPLADLFIFKPVYRTTRPNGETTVVIPLGYAALDTARSLDDRQVDPVLKNQYLLLQQINFTAEEKTLGAALAKIEVISVGDNVSIGTSQRGFVLDGLTARDNRHLFDANLNTSSAVFPVSFATRVDTWQSQGTWFYVDLGALFWIDELFLYVLTDQETGRDAGPPRGFAFLSSDGSRAITTALPVPEKIDFTALLEQPDPRPIRYLRYFFQPRRIRYLFWHVLDPTGWRSRWAELMLFSPGHPARVELRSDFIDLGAIVGDNLPKVMQNLVWDADLPPGTQLRLRSRSGNELDQVITFFNRAGEKISETAWKSLPKVVRGQIDTAVVVGQDWDAWSEEYQFSGEAFKSKSPRRFVQLEMTLSTDDPQLAPTVHALSIDFDNALVQAAQGQIEPRRARPNEQTNFTYTLWVEADERDSGFDLLRFVVPDATAGLNVQIGGQNIIPEQVWSQDDSLFIALSRPIKGDSLQVRFATRLVEDATLFALDLGLRERPGLWQSVEPSVRRANIVQLPELVANNNLIGDLQVSTPVLTPNGDGVHDEVEIEFVAFKVEDSTALLQLFDAAGRRVNELSATGGGRRRFVWDGRDLSGELVPPGIYLYRIDLGAAVGDDKALGVLSVVY